MREHTLILTPPEEAAVKAINQDLPETLEAFSIWLTEVLDDLVRTSQGRVVTEADADNLLSDLRNEAVRCMLAAMESWDADEHLREPMVELLVRHLLADAREWFVQRVVMMAWN